MSNNCLRYLWIFSCRLSNSRKSPRAGLWRIESCIHLAQKWPQPTSEIVVIGYQLSLNLRRSNFSESLLRNPECWVRRLFTILYIYIFWMDKRDWDFSTGTWNLSTKRFKNDSSSSNSVTDAPIDDTTSRSTSSPPGWTGSSSGWKPEHEKSFQSGISPHCGNPLDQK